MLRDVGAHAPENVDDGTPGRVRADPFERSSASGWIDAATSQNAARGRVGRDGLVDRRHGGRSRDAHGVAAVGRGVLVHGDAPGPKHPLGVVARRDLFRDPRLAVRGETREQDRRLQLRARDGRLVVDRGQRRAAGDRERQQRAPRRPAKRAPIARSGSTTRPIGRRRSDASPSSTAKSGRPARTPASRRAVVPELPQSRTPRARGARRRPASGRGSRRARRVGNSLDLRAQRRNDAGRRAHVLAVARRGDPALPSASSASRSDRWEIDLSPGRAGAPRRRAAGRTTRSSSATVRGHVRGSGRVGGHVAASALSRSPWRSLTWSWTPAIARHHLLEPLEVELLLGVRERLVGPRVDLDHDAVGAHRDAADRERLDEPALAGGVRRVDDHRQVGQVVERAARR